MRVLLLLHHDLMPPESIEGLSDTEVAPFRTEYDVRTGLTDLGHEVLLQPVADELGPIRRAIQETRPHIAFNLLVEFQGVGIYDAHVISWLELLKCPYSGCNPRGMLLARDKALTKKILAWHRIPVPQFAVFPLGKPVRLRRPLQFPLIVKSTIEEASLGISQASIVADEERLAERVEFVHRTVGTDAIAEEYIEGRELTIGVLGNQRLTTFPVWEMRFNKLPEGVAPIATARVKWDLEYQQKIGIECGRAEGIAPELEARMARLAKRVYRALGLSGYARLDLRLAPDGRVWVLEANPNPELAYGEDFAESAASTGLKYPQLLQRILNLGRRYRAAWKHD